MALAFPEPQLCLLPSKICALPHLYHICFGIGLPVDSRLVIMIPVQCLYVTFLVNRCTNPCEANLLSVAQDHQGSIGVPGHGGWHPI